MNNKENWVPTKFVYKNGRLIASRNPKEIFLGQCTAVVFPDSNQG